MNGTQFECLNPLSYGVEPNPEELLHLELGYGLMNYEDIGHSLFSTTKQIFQTGSSRLLTLEKQAMQRVLVELYNYSFMVLMYFYSNLAPTF